MELFTDLTNIIRAYTYTYAFILDVCMCMSVCDAYTGYRKYCPISESH